MHTSLDPLADDVINDPYPFLARARKDSPVAYCEPIDMWLVTRHKDVEEVFLDPKRFSASIAQAPLMPLCDEAMAILKADFGIQPTMSNFDPPGHSRIRRTLARAFSTRRMRILEPVILQRCREILDGFADQGSADLARELCYPLPALTIFAMIGFPDEDADQIKSWCADKLVVNWGRPSAEAQVRAAQTMVAFWKYCVAYVKRRRDDPGDNLVADLMQDPDVSEPLTDNEISSIIFGLSFAGHETTTNQLANCIRAICDHGLWQQLRVDRDLIPGVVEESLRQVSSVIAWRRIAVEDTTIGDTPVPKGAKLLLSLAGANRDPDVFPEPDAFNPGRDNTRAHLSFGKGIHLCLGAHLARMEIGIVLNEMLDRFEELRLDESQELEFPPNVAFWGPISLKANWKLA